MAQQQTPQSNVDSMFQKMGEKLGWFQYKDLDSAMKTLSDKKKHNKSRLRLRSKQDKENRPVLNLNQQEVHSGELSKENRLKEILVGSNKEYKEIPLRKSPASTDLTQDNSSQEVYHTAPTNPVSKDSQKSKYLKSSSNAIKQNPMSCHQGMASQNFGQKLKEKPKEAHAGNEALEHCKDSQEKNSEQSSQSQKLYNMSVIAGQNDGDLFSMLEDVGVPLVESTRIYSRQSIDVFGLSINEETGENDSYENLQIQQKNKRENRNSDLYSTAVEPENDFYTVTDTATQTDVEFPSPQNSPMYTPVPIKTSSTLELKQNSSNKPKLSSATKPKPSSATKPKPSSATKPKPSSATKHTTSARKVAKMKALLSSSDSEEEMLSPEVSKSKYFTPKPGKKPSVSDTNKSKFFTPKSPTRADLSDSDDSVTGLNLERYKITIEQPSPSWRSARVISDSSDDDDFDQFLESVKPQVKPVKEVLKRSLSDFIDDDEIVTDETDSESEEEIFISIQSPKNRGCTIVSPVSKRYSPSVVDVNKPHRLKTPTSTLHSTPQTSHTERLKTPSTHIHNTLKTPHISHAATRPYSTTCTELFKTPLRPKELTTPKERSYSDKPTVHDNHKCSFIKSLTTELDESRRHPDSIKYIKQFKKNYEELTSRLFKLYNETIFDKKLPEDMSITWNKRLLRTAGYCAYKRCHGKHVARIELSTKVCDNAERVRDTLIHELCHAAVWMLNQRTDGHGPYWKYWARKSNLSHPELPIISRCHNYSISTKYTYTCTQCGYQIGRHSKSLDTTKKVCGHCHGRFQLMGTPGSKEGTPRTPNKFALFVKENYGSAKKTNSDFKHKEIMQLLSQQFANKTKLDS